MSIKVSHTALSVVFPTSASTTVSAAIGQGQGDGWCQLMSFAMPGFSANVSGTVTVYDNSGAAVYVSSTSILSSSATVRMPTYNIPIEGGGLACLSITLNGIPGSAAGTSAIPSTATAHLYLG